MVRSGQLGASRCCGCRGPPACLGGSPEGAGHLSRVPGGLEREIPNQEAATEPPVAGFGAWRGVRRSGPHSEVRDILISILGHSGPSLYGFGASRVSIDRLAEAPLLCAPAAVSPPQCEERSDQIGGTGVTCGPRRPKRLVMGSQGHGDNPAAASRRRTPSYKYTTTRLRTLTPPPPHSPRAPFAVTTCAPSVPHATAGSTSSSGACSARASPIFVESASPPGTACAALGALFCSARAPRGPTRDLRGAGGPSGP